MSNVATQPLNNDSIFGHKPGLFLLFFTEMWERFSYYGMRALLTIFLISEVADGGWGWSRESALHLYGWYTGLVYLTPIFGGLLADRVFGYRNAILLGALLMTLGHAAMALETTNAFYTGLGLLIVGNGFFKPNISSMVGQLYSDDERKKDGAYTIFYMGINAGAFLGILLCGFIGEQVSWSYGFGLAGVFMALGMVMFFLGQPIFGDIGTKGYGEDEALQTRVTEANEATELIPAETIGVVGRDRLTVVAVLSFFTIFFWMAFEQAGGSMSIFAKDYTSRVLSGGAAQWFFVVNALLTIAPLAIITFVLLKLFGKTFSRIPVSNMSIGLSFVLVWAIAIWMLASQYQTQESETEIPASWFGILNSFFIIAFAPLFSNIWASRFNPSAPVKFAIGLGLLGLGFGVLAIGSSGIEKGAATAAVSVWWLIAAYLLHTLGELCVSPVGLSYVSKLTPTKLVGVMFGIWFGASFVANLLGGYTGSYIDRISETYGLSTFFAIFTAIPLLAGLLMLIISGVLKRKMHGIH